MNSFALIFAQQLPPRYEFARLQGFTENWQYALLGLVCAAVIAFVIYMYRRDSVELKPGVGVLLMALRLFAFVGLLLHFLHLEKRDPVVITQNSQVLIAIDTSASMNQLNVNSTSTIPSGPTRLDTVLSFLQEQPWLNELRKKHDVLLYRFDREKRSINTIRKLSPESVEKTSTTAANDAANATGTPAVNSPQDVKWQDFRVESGPESRYGQLIRELTQDEGKQPTLAGMIVVGDFANNFGLSPDVAAKEAAEAKIPIFTVGIGSPEVPINIGIADFRVPPRAYPKDSFKISALITARGLPKKPGGGPNGGLPGTCSVTADLYLKPADPQGKESADPGTLVNSQTLQLTDGREEPFEHELPGNAEPGRLTFTLVLKGNDLGKDANKSDNQTQGDLEVVARSNRVLLFAGGPTREYQFLRNQLRRDNYSQVDIFLQSAEEGISQDANAILDDFPTTREQIAEYDVIVGFDPDWRQLTEEQINLLDDWVAKDSGGLVAVAGPVYMDEWLQTDEKLKQQLKKIRSMYPVEFDSKLSAINNSKFDSELAWPIEFTPEGMEADFLWLGSTREESEQNWRDFPGVFGFYQVRGPKPGALTYGYFSNPNSSSTSSKPIYFAEQFWGSGRVFYLGSGEMWRLRRIGDGYFEQFYTKLMRHVSQGRLLRGSRRGTLLLDRERFVQGSTIPIRAQLENPLHGPLEKEAVDLRVQLPDFTSKTVLLKADPGRAGMFNGQLPALQVGTYQLQLAIPDSPDVLTKRIQVNAPQLEIDNPQRNDALGKTIADATQGIYLVGMAELLGNPEKGLKPIAELLSDQTREKREYGVDPQFEKTWLQWLMLGIVGCLCLEWIVRRVCRLA